MSVAAAVRPPGVGVVLRRAARDLYDESWKLVLLNTALSVYVLVVVSLAAFVPAALVLVVGAGPLAAALVVAAVTIVETGSVSLDEVVRGLRGCWLRGLALGASLAVAAIASVTAFAFYGSTGTLAWPLAVLVLYLGGIFALYQLVLWPLAVRDPERPLRDVVADAALVLARRPATTTALGVALLAVNVAGILAAVLPFLTVTIAYSALAAARYALTAMPSEEAEPWQT